jgi:hypothetical protein
MSLKSIQMSGNCSGSGTVAGYDEVVRVKRGWQISPVEQASVLRATKSAITTVRRPPLGTSAVDNRSVTDVDEGSRESRELEGQVVAAFGAPESLGPLPTDRRRRPLLRLSERPSFGNYRCWAVWGPNEVVGHPNRNAIVRRIVWRRDLDGDRSNPMRRLQRLGQPLRPSLEVADAIVDAAQLDVLMDASPPLKTPTQTMLNPRSLTLDGERYTIEIDGGARRWLFEWVGVNRDWTPTAVDDIAVATWARELRDFLDAVVTPDGRQRRPG